MNDRSQTDPLCYLEKRKDLYAYLNLPVILFSYARYMLQDLNCSGELFDGPWGQVKLSQCDLAESHPIKKPFKN